MRCLVWRRCRWRILHLTISLEVGRTGIDLQPVGFLPFLIFSCTSPLLLTVHGIRLRSWHALQKHCQLFNLSGFVCQPHDLWAQEKWKGINVKKLHCFVSQSLFPEICFKNQIRLTKPERRERGIKSSFIPLWCKSKPLAWYPEDL